MKSHSISLAKGIGNLLIGIGILLLFISLSQFLFLLWFPEIEVHTTLPSHLPYYFLGLIANQIIGFGLPAWLLIRLQLNENPSFTANISIHTVGLIALMVIGELLFIHLMILPYSIYQKFLPPDFVHRLQELTSFQNQFIQTTVQSNPFLYSLVSLALIPAICEELLFRNYLFKSLIHFTPIWLSTLLSSFIFSFIHFEMEGFLARFFLGIILALLYWGSGYQLLCPILFHFLHNGIQTFILYAFNEDRIPFENQPSFPIAVMGLLIFALSGFLFLKTSYQNHDDRITETHPNSNHWRE